MVKVGIEEDFMTTNVWPVMLLCCVKKEYSSIEDIIGDDIFNQCFLPLEFSISHKRDQSVPDDLRMLGNIPDISGHCKKCVKF